MHSAFLSPHNYQKGATGSDDLPLFNHLKGGIILVFKSRGL